MTQKESNNSLFFLCLAYGSDNNQLFDTALYVHFKLILTQSNGVSTGTCSINKKHKSIAHKHVQSATRALI